MMKRRFPHYLRPLGSGKWPQAIICVDAASVVDETVSPQAALVERLTGWFAELLVRHGNTYLTRYVCDGKTQSQWWEKLASALRRTQCAWIVSYRACRIWSLLGLWDEISSGVVSLVQRPNEARISGATHTTQEATGYIVCEDPPNILNARLYEMSRPFVWVDLRNYGVERPQDVDCGTSTVSWLAKSFQSIASALHTAKMGGLRATASAQALAGFRTGYYNGGIYCHNHTGALSLESSAYYGGRCEVSSIGVCGVTVYHLDYRSLYPSCCVNGKLPVRLISCNAVQGQVEIPLESSGIGAIADVDIETNEPAYPYRRISNNRDRSHASRDSVAHGLLLADTDIIYPIGRFRTVLSGPELFDAIARGRVHRVHKLALYEMEPALRDYAISMHKMRSNAESESNVAVAQLAKMLSVCIAGKFGQRLRIWEYEPNVIAHDPYGEWWGCNNCGKSVRYRSIGWTVWRDRILGWSQEAVPAIAAWITSAGRIALLSAIRCAGWDNTFYYDTDSIFVNEAGYDKIAAANRIADKKLGFLQFKGRSSFASFNGIKDYAFGDELRSAGTPRGYYADAGDGQHYWYNTSASGDIKKGRKPDGRSILVHYHRDGEYRHGVVDDNGNVTPFLLHEW